MALRRCSTMLLCLLLLTPPAFLGQGPVAVRPRVSPPEDSQHPASIRTDTNLVVVPVTVCNPLNQPVTGLEKEHFKLFDDKVEQTITHFSMDDEPVTVGLVFDISGSMGTKLRESRQAAAEFFKTANPDDDFFLVEFNDQPRMVATLGTPIPDIQNLLTFSQSKGRTALLDAVFLAMHELKKSSKNRKALLIISDGGDNSSRYSESEVRNLVREGDAMIYAIGVYDSAGSRRTPEEASGPGLLNELCEQTGGRHFPADVSDLPDVAAKIGVELRTRYMLGFTPTDQHHDGRYHPVVVKVIPPHGLPSLHAYWRRGYYAPTN